MARVRRSRGRKPVPGADKPHRKDAAGRPFRLNLIFGHPLNGLLQGLVEGRRPGQWTSKVMRWPRPKPALNLIKTTQGTATVCERGHNPGSTNPMYAYVWWAQKRPATSSLRFYPWASEDRQVDCLFIDDPGTRQQGRAGTAEIDMERREVQAQRTSTGAYFDDESPQFREGWKKALLPAVRCCGISI